MINRINSLTKTQNPNKRQIQANDNDSDFNDFINTTHETLCEEHIIETLDDEIGFYDKINLSTEINRSKFWIDNEIKLPRLSKLVKSICCGTPATVDSERDFSMGKDIISSKRNSLSNNNVEYISFLKRNMNKDFSIKK